MDIKVKEISEEYLARGKKIYEKPRFIYRVDRIGSDTQIICVGKIKDIIKKDFGKPLHSVVICVKTLPSIEKEILLFYSK